MCLRMFLRALQLLQNNLASKHIEMCLLPLSGDINSMIPKTAFRFNITIIEGTTSDFVLSPFKLNTYEIFD